MPNSTTHRRWGKRIAKERAERKLSQNQLAVAISVNPTSVWRMERGDIAPSDITRVRLSAFFGIPVHELFPYPTLTQLERETRAAERAAETAAAVA